MSHAGTTEAIRERAGAALREVHVARAMAARVAGMPVSVLERLSTPEVAMAVERVLDREERLREDGEHLCDRLYPVIGNAGGALRGRLVGLRRCLHNLRAPASSEWGPEVEAAIPEPVRHGVTAWLDELHELREDGVVLQRALASVHEAVSQVLSEALDDEAFALGLQEANGALWRQARRSGPGNGKRRAHLARYVNRAASKTSPRTWFGTWVPARLHPGTEQVGWAGTEAERRPVVEPSMYVLSRWFDRAAAEPGMDRRSPLAPAPTLKRVGDKVAFVNRAGDVVRVTWTTALGAVLELAGVQPPPSHATLVEQLAERTGTPERAEAFVRSLREAELLQVRFAMRPGEDVLDALTRNWRSVVAPFPELAGQLDRWQELSRDAAGDDATSRWERLDDRDLDVLRGHEDLPLVWEDTVVTGSCLRVPEAVVRDAGDTVASTLTLLGLFDMGLENRRRLAALWERHWPQRDEAGLLELYELVVADRRGSDTSAAQQPERSPASDVRSLRERFLERWEEAAGPELHLGDDDLATLFAAAPPDVEPPPCAVLHVQLDGRTGRTRLVLNDVFRGARAPARVARLLERAGAEPPGDLPLEPSAGSCTFLDILAPFGSNLTLRAGGTHPVLMVPDCVVEPPPARRCVDPTELTVRRAGQRCELWWPDAGTRVLMHPTGMMSELWMPPLAAFVVLYFSYAPAKPPFLEQWARHCIDAGLEVAAFPRVTLDDRLVLERRTHVVDLRVLPLDAPAHDAAGLLAVGRALREHGISRRSFVRVLDLERFVQRDPRPYKARKPLFVDLGSPVWVDQVRRLARDGATHAVFQEALPDPRESPPGPDGQPRVTEFLLECSVAGASTASSA